MRRTIIDRVFHRAHPARRALRPIPFEQEELEASAKTAELRSFNAGDVLFNEGTMPDGLHLIRSGSVSVSRRIGGRDIVTSYVAAGNYVGEMGLSARRIPIGNRRVQPSQPNPCS